jgi:hypothetical protein
MTFDYNTLEKAARNCSRLGEWKGKPVFATSVKNLDNKGSGVYYILYDDENKIVARTKNGLKSFGIVMEQGIIHEYSSARNYKTPFKPQTSIFQVEGSYSPGYSSAERPVGDVKAEIDIEKVLKSAREMSVESLLDGFLKGVVENG